MDADERAVYYYVKSMRPVSATGRDISRRVGGKRKFHFNPEWVAPVLERMLARGILQAKTDGSYCLKPAPPKNMDGKRWVSPHIAAILNNSGKAFDSVITPEDEDAYYENL